MLAILQIKMQWTKDSRTPTGSRQRQTYYKPVMIENDVSLSGNGIFVKKCNYLQQSGVVKCDMEVSKGVFYSPDKVDIPCVEIIEEAERDYRIKWFDDGRGMPKRRGGNEDLYVKGAKLAGRPNTLNETAFILREGESGVLRYNYRLTSYHGQWYECYYVYIVNAKELWQDVFIREYTYDYNQLADLF